MKTQKTESGYEEKKDMWHSPRFVNDTAAKLALCSLAGRALQNPKYTLTHDHTTSRLLHSTIQFIYDKPKKKEEWVSEVIVASTNGMKKST